MENKEYLKREKQRKLDGFQEYKAVSFGFGASLILSVILLFNAVNLIDKTVNRVMLAVSSAYILTTVIQLVIMMYVKRDILANGKIRRSIRRCGIILLLFTFTGNFFATIAGFCLIKEKRSLEYTLSTYAVQTTVFILLISCINLFKEHLAYTFMPGIVLLLILTLFYIIVIALVAKYVNGKFVDKRLEPIAYILIVSAVTGNVFALILGIMIIQKIHHKNADISIEWIDILKRIFRNNLSVVGLFIVILLLSLSICSNLTFDYAIATENNYSAILQQPSMQYPFGTDNFGRCVFTRIVFGARISLMIGMAATILPVIIGGILGAIAGFYGKKVDNIIMRILDILYAVPGMLLAIAIVAAFGASTINLILALSIGSIPVYARTVRATVLSLSNVEFVEAAKACGASDSVIILKHILPNSLAPLIVRASLSIGSAVLSTSGLSYLGLGVEPWVPEWGNVLKAGSEYLETNPYLAIFPGIAIIVIVLAFNFFGDGLRDALDPKLK